MGVVKRQGIKRSAVTLVGSIIGMLNTVFIYTTFLQKEELGFIVTLVSLGTLIAPFVYLSAPAIATKYFPYFSDGKKNNGFLFLLIALGLFGSFLFLILNFIPLFQTTFYSKYIEENPFFTDMIPYLPILVSGMAFQGIFYNYVVNFKRIVVPEIIINLNQKIIYPLLCISFFYQLINFESLSKFYVFIFLFNTICLIGYTFWLGEFKFSFKINFPSQVSKKEMLMYGVMSFFSTLGSFAISEIDKLMISGILSFGETGVYTISLFIANVIAMPGHSLFLIATPLISQQMKNYDLASIDSIYKKTSVIGSWACMLIFMGVLLTVNDLFDLMPEGDVYRAGIIIIPVIGASKLVDVLFSVNAHIIQYSKYYYVNTISIVGLGVLNFFLNLSFIQAFGLIGAAWASLISITVYNISRGLFIYYKFGLQPFNNKSIYVILIAISLAGAISIIPSTSFSILNIFIKGGLFVLLYLLLSYKLNISKDINELIESSIAKVRGVLRF